MHKRAMNGIASIKIVGDATSVRQSVTTFVRRLRRAAEIVYGVGVKSILSRRTPHQTDRENACEYEQPFEHGIPKNRPRAAGAPKDHAEQRDQTGE
jgi:hypothetical protein